MAPTPDRSVNRVDAPTPPLKQADTHIDLLDPRDAGPPHADVANLAASLTKRNQSF